MSRAHKQSEANQTTETEPSRLSRQRAEFLARLSACKGKVERRQRPILGAYKPLVFKAQVIYDNVAAETRVFVGEQDLGALPYVCVNVEDFHHLLASDRDFEADSESSMLNCYVGRGKQRGDTSCHLENVEDDGFVSCGSVINCPFRSWNAERNLPQCAR